MTPGVGTGELGGRGAGAVGVPDVAEPAAAGPDVDRTAGRGGAGGRTVTDESSMLGATVGDASALGALAPPQPLNAARASSAAASPVIVVETCFRSFTVVSSCAIADPSEADWHG
jgi:hypothetical protein